MLKFINDILASFRVCFSRTASYKWFVIIVVGLMLRRDQLGVTSVIRDLSLKPKSYEPLIHFFRSSAWSLDSLRLKWFQVVKRFAPLFTLHGAIVLIGDGIKLPKEASRMPGVKRLHQESENSSKAEYIFGHLFGAVGILMGTPQKWFYLPLFMNLQDGVKTILGWDSPEEPQDSHVVQMIDSGVKAAGVFGKSILLLDRYFLSIPALLRWKDANALADAPMHLVTKAKSNAVAYERPPARKKGKGRPRKKGRTLKLNELFKTRACEFRTANVMMYGKMEVVEFLALDLLWGQGLYQELRFVLVKWGDRYSILVGTDLTMDATDMIELYGYRFKIECTFREMKQVVGGLSYHFWSKSMPKLKRYLKKGEPHPIEQVICGRERKRILETVKAIEGFVMCSCIAMGMLQMIAVRYSSGVPGLFRRYLRTPTGTIVSEATVKAYLSSSIFCMFAKNPQLAITKIIESKQEIPTFSEDLMVS